MGPEEALVTFVSDSLPDAPASNPAAPTASRAAKPAAAIRGETLEATFRASSGGHVPAGRPTRSPACCSAHPHLGRYGIDAWESSHPSVLQLGQSAAPR